MNQDDGPGEDVGMLPYRGDRGEDPSSNAAQKRRSGGSAGTIGGMANGSGAGGVARSEVIYETKFFVSFF